MLNKVINYIWCVLFMLYASFYLVVAVASLAYAMQGEILYVALFALSSAITNMLCIEADKCLTRGYYEMRLNE